VKQFVGLRTPLRIAAAASIVWVLGGAMFLSSPAFDAPVAAQETAATDGVAEPTAPLYPLAVAIGPDKARYVVDRNLPGVWKIVDGQASILVRGSKINREPLNAPRSIAVSSDGRVFVGDSGGCNVFEVSADAPPRPISSERIGIPMGLAFDSQGNLFVADIELHRILKLVPGSEPVEPTEVAAIRAPRALACDKEDRVWVVSGYENPVRRIEANGQVTTIVSSDVLQYPAGIAIDAVGSIWVSDSYAKTIYRIGEDGTTTPLPSSETLVYPVGIAADGTGIVVADPRGPALRQVDGAGAVTTEFPR